MVHKCASELHEWLKKNKLSSGLKRWSKLSQRQLDQMVKSIHGIAVSRMAADPSLTQSAAFEQAKLLWMEQQRQSVELGKENARLNVIALAEQRRILKANDFNANKARSSIINGRMHEGVGVRGGINGAIGAKFQQLLNGKDGLFTKLRQHDGFKLLKNRGNEARVADQIHKDEFTNDDIGKVARAVKEHNHNKVKMMKISGIHITELAGRMMKRFHDSVKLLNPKGLRKSYKSDPRYRNAVSAGDRERVRTTVAFERWRDYIKPNLDMRLSLLDVDKTDPKAVDKALRGIFDEITSESTSEGKPARPSNFAKRVSAPHRSLHFNSGAAEIDYSYEYGAGGLLQTLEMEARRDATNMAVTEKLGPDAAGNYQKIRNELVEANKGKPSAGNVIQGMDRDVNYLMGEIKGASNSRLSAIANNIQMFNNLKSLGMVWFHVLSDYSNMWGTLSHMGVTFGHKLEAMVGTAAHMFKKGSEDEQHFYECLSAASHHVIGSQRFGQSIGMGNGTLTKLNGLMFKINGLSAHDNAMRKGLLGTISRYLGLNANKTFEALPDRLQRLFKLYDIQPDEWEAWRQRTSLLNKQKYLTPDAFHSLTEDEELKLGLNKAQLEQKMMNFMHDQYKYIVPSSDISDLAARKERANSPWGMAANLALQYKSYSLGFTRNIIMRSIKGTSSKGEMVQSLIQTIVGTAALGYLGEVGTSILKNKRPPSLLGDADDPHRDLHRINAWQRAILPALGLYGDGINALTDSKVDIASELLGPTYGVANNTAQYIHTMGKRALGLTHSQRKSSALLSYQFAKRNLPFGNYFGTVAALNYGVGKGIMNFLQPGSYDQMVHHLQTQGESPIIQ